MLRKLLSLIILIATFSAFALAGGVTAAKATDSRNPGVVVFTPNDGTCGWGWPNFSIYLGYGTIVESTSPFRVKLYVCKATLAFGPGVDTTVRATFGPCDYLLTPSGEGVQVCRGI